MFETEREKSIHRLSRRLGDDPVYKALMVFEERMKTHEDDDERWTAYFNMSSLIRELSHFYKVDETFIHSAIYAINPTLLGRVYPLPRDTPTSMHPVANTVALGTTSLPA